jgi:hypothetical protein
VHLGARVPEDGKVAGDERVGGRGSEKGVGHPPIIAPCPPVLKSRGEVMV